jgi:hypothetical protein
MNIEHLYAIREKNIVDVRQEISTTVPINDISEDKILTEIPLVLLFDCYRLFIYNNWSITGYLKNFKELIGRKVVEISIENKFLVLKLSDSISLKVDVSDDGFNGPESLVLHGPNNLLVVWN